MDGISYVRAQNNWIVLQRAVVKGKGMIALAMFFLNGSSNSLEVLVMFRKCFNKATKGLAWKIFGPSYLPITAVGILGAFQFRKRIFLGIKINHSL